eukprot:5478391-Pyramimonas_sp.AAC.1
MVESPTSRRQRACKPPRSCAQHVLDLLRPVTRRDVVRASDVVHGRIERQVVGFSCDGATRVTKLLDWVPSFFLPPLVHA